MGRHRPDPRGHARILVATFAVVVAVVLLVIGAFALAGAMRSSGTPASNATVAPSKVPQSARDNSPSAADYAMFIKVTTQQATVMVTTTDNSTVLFQGVLHKGEWRGYTQTNLVATVDPAQNTEVSIDGKIVSSGKQGKVYFRN